MIGPALAGVAAAAVAGGGAMALRRRRARLRDPAHVMADAAACLTGFDPVSAVVGDDGEAALTVAADGRVAVLRARRGPPLVREIGWTAVRATPGGIEVSPNGGARVLLRGVDALDVRRLAPAGTRAMAAE